MLLKGIRRVGGIGDELAAALISRRVCRFEWFECWHDRAFLGQVLSPHHLLADESQSCALGYAG